MAFDLELHRGEAVALLEADGSGKTTSVRLARGEITRRGDVVQAGSNNSNARLYQDHI